MAGDDHVGRLDVAVGDLAIMKQLADRVGQPMDQRTASPGLTGSRRPSRCSRSTWARLMPSVQVSTTSTWPSRLLAIDRTWKAVVLDPSQHAEILLGRRAAGPCLEEEIVSARSREGIERQIALARGLPMRSRKIVVSPSHSSCVR